MRAIAADPMLRQYLPCSRWCDGSGRNPHGAEVLWHEHLGPIESGMFWTDTRFNTSVLQLTWYCTIRDDGQGDVVAAADFAMVQMCSVVILFLFVLYVESGMFSYDAWCNETVPYTVKLAGFFCFFHFCAGHIASMKCRSSSLNPTESKDFLSWAVMNHNFCPFPSCHMHDQHTKPHRITTIPPMQCYLPDRKNNAEDKRKEQPLKASQNLNGLRESGEEALVVVVLLPSQPPHHQSTHAQSFPPCQLPFFNSIQTITERGEWILFGQEVIPSTSFNSPYISKYFQTIASRIIPVSGIHKAIITGTPIIGKSLFLIDLLWRLFKEGKHVFIFDSLNIYYDENGVVCSLSAVTLCINKRFWNDTLRCLFDAKFEKGIRSGAFTRGLSMFIVSTCINWFAIGWW